MPKLLPDQSFYPSPTLAMQAPVETMAYVALLNPDPGAHDALAVLDVNPSSAGYGAQIARIDMPHAGDELHHFGWNACSSCLCPNSPHPHMHRRYLLVPGMRSSRIHILDTAPDPRRPKLVKVIEAEEIIRKTGYSRPHTVHCGPDGIYVNALGNADGDGPGGIFVLDPETFDIKGRWERDRGPQHLSYDFWWHLGHDTMITSEWGTPNMVENGVVPEPAAGRQVRQLAARVGSQQPASPPASRARARVSDGARAAARARSERDLRLRRLSSRASRSVGVRLDVAPRRRQEERRWRVRKVSRFRQNRRRPTICRHCSRGFGAVPPLVTDINLSLDDRFLYVSCFGTGELKQYDVSDPFNPGRDRAR
jgi:selenium-binding protein 1